MDAVCGGCKLESLLDGEAFFSDSEEDQIYDFWGRFSGCQITKIIQTAAMLTISPMSGMSYCSIETSRVTPSKSHKRNQPKV